MPSMIYAMEPPNSPTLQGLLISRSSGDEAEAQSREGTCPRSYIWQTVGSGKARAVWLQSPHAGLDFPHQPDSRVIFQAYLLDPPPSTISLLPSPRKASPALPFLPGPSISPYPALLCPSTSLHLPDSHPSPPPSPLAAFLPEPLRGCLLHEDTTTFYSRSLSSFVCCSYTWRVFTPVVFLFVPLPSSPLLS